MIIDMATDYFTVLGIIIHSRFRFELNVEIAIQIAANIIKKLILHLGNLKK